MNELEFKIKLINVDTEKKIKFRHTVKTHNREERDVLVSVIDDIYDFMKPNEILLSIEIITP